MQKILVSACLLGANVRYNAVPKPYHHAKLSQWRNQGRLITVCPEVAGGLATPRPAAEYQPSKQLIMNTQGQDVTDAFLSGAKHALTLCKKHNISFALLKEFSPSCGRQKIYDGSFTNNKVEGQGLTAKILIENGIKVYSELMMEELIAVVEE